MNSTRLSKRLHTVASFVRNGAVVADIGTDHAYLPIHLVQVGISPLAVATDINEGPILRAKHNISISNLQDKIVCYVAPGLCGIEEHSPNDIMICGMGGELIAQILSESDYVKNREINLILQPMTSILELREYLSCGFDIYDEKIVHEDGKFYQIICAKYSGNSHEYSNAELELGKINIERREDTFLKLLGFTIEKKKKILQGLLAGNCDTEKIEEEIREMESLK